MKEIVISDDKSRLDFGKNHHFLSTQSTWAKGITLDTSNAHGLYAKYGFNALSKPETFMEIYRPDIYAD